VRHCPFFIKDSEENYTLDPTFIARFPETINKLKKRRETNRFINSGKLLITSECINAGKEKKRGDK
jgi:hypothetical protein